MLQLIRDPAVTDREKEMLIMKNLIPLFSASANNHAVNMQNVFDSACFNDYISVFLPSLHAASASSTPFLIALLKLNTLLVKYCSALISPSAKNTLFSFAWNLYLGTDDEFFQTSLSQGDLFEDTFEKIQNIRNLARHPYEFYQKQGFQIVGVLPDANGPGKPDIWMAKRVTARDMTRTAL